MTQLEVTFLDISQPQIFPHPFLNIQYETMLRLNKTRRKVKRSTEELLWDSAVDTPKKICLTSIDILKPNSFEMI